MTGSRDTALLVFGIEPIRIGGIELQTRALVERLVSMGTAALAFSNGNPLGPKTRDAGRDTVVLSVGKTF